MCEKPYWHPLQRQQEFINEMKIDYPEDAHLSDDEIMKKHEEFGRKYSVCWDHIGDAWNDYEPLADAFIELEEKYNKLKGKNNGIR